MAIPGFDAAMREVSERGAADSRAKTSDLDETRRLLYMAVVAPRCKRYNLAGTLINALRHHHGVDDADLEDIVVSLVNGDSAADDEGWARQQIQRCTESLGGAR